MKIGIIAWDRFGYGGVSRTLSTLVKELSTDNDVKILCLKKEQYLQNVYNIDLGRVKFEFTEMTFLGKIRRELTNRLLRKRLYSENSFFIRNYPYIRFSRSYLRKIIGWIDRHEFDVVMFGSGFEDSIQLAAIQGQIRKDIKLVAWSHASFKDYFKNDMAVGGNNLRNIWKKYYPVFDKIVVLSDFDQAECQQKLGLTATRIYNCCDIMPSFRATLDTNKFLYIGALSFNKGSDILIDGFVEFAKKNHTWSLDIYGEGPGKEYIERQIQAYGLENRVRLMGYISDVAKAYITHDVLIFPSRYEGFGIVQIEAAKCGLPVLAADLPVTRELIGKYGYGELFKWNNPQSLAEQMHSLIKKDLKTYGDNGIIAAQDFTPGAFANQWRKLFLTLTR